MLARIERFLLDLGVFSVLALCVLITANVIGRATLNQSIPDAYIMVTELMVAAIVLPLAATTAGRGHIAVDFVTNRFSLRVRAMFIVLGSVVGLLALLPLIYAGWRELLHTATSGGFFFGQLNLPKWPGRALFFTGIVFCWIRLLLLVIADIRAIRAGDYQSITDAEVGQA